MQHYIYLIHSSLSEFILGYHLYIVDAILSLSMALLHDVYRNIKMRRCILDAVMCGVLAWFARDVINLMGWEVRWANILSVLIGFLGNDYFGKVLIVIIDKLILRK